MALTITRTGYEPKGAARPMRAGLGYDIVMTLGEFTFDSDYATGGETLAASSMGLLDVLFITFSIEPSAGTAAKGQMLAGAQYDYTHTKVLAMGVTGMGPGTLETVMEIAHHTDLSAYTVRFIAFGHKLQGI